MSMSQLNKFSNFKEDIRLRTMTTIPTFYIRRNNTQSYNVRNQIVFDLETTAAIEFDGQEKWNKNDER